MPRHKRVTACRKGGPVSKHCSCEHCTLAVCSVCGGFEGALTTDCPGTKVDSDKLKEVFETSLDYTDDRSWHLADPTKRRAARFEHTEVPPEPPRADPRSQVAPSIDWATVDHYAVLQHELTKKALAWVLADRSCEEHSASLARVEDEGRQAILAGYVIDRESVLARLERAKVYFHLADQLAQRCDDEFRQAARQLVDALESSNGLPTRVDADLHAPKGST